MFNAVNYQRKSWWPQAAIEYSMDDEAHHAERVVTRRALPTQSLKITNADDVAYCIDTEAQAHNIKAATARQRIANRKRSQ